MLTSLLIGKDRMVEILSVLFLESTWKFPMSQHFRVLVNGTTIKGDNIKGTGAHSIYRQSWFMRLGRTLVSLIPVFMIYLWMGLWEAERTYTRYGHIGFLAKVQVPKAAAALGSRSGRWLGQCIRSLYVAIDGVRPRTWLEAASDYAREWGGWIDGLRKPYNVARVGIWGVERWTHQNPVAGWLHAKGMDLDAIDLLPLLIKSVCILIVVYKLAKTLREILRDEIVMQQDMTISLLDGNLTTADCEPVEGASEEDESQRNDNSDYILRETLRTKFRGLPRRLNCRAIDLRHELCRLLPAESKFDSPENRSLVTARAQRVATCLMATDLRYKSLRKQDITAMIYLAVELYFVPTDDELQIQEQFESNPEHDARKARYRYLGPVSL